MCKGAVGEHLARLVVEDFEGLQVVDAQSVRKGHMSLKAERPKEEGFVLRQKCAFGRVSAFGDVVRFWVRAVGVGGLAGLGVMGGEESVDVQYASR